MLTRNAYNGHYHVQFTAIIWTKTICPVTGNLLVHEVLYRVPEGSYLQLTDLRIQGELPENTLNNETEKDNEL